MTVLESSQVNALVVPKLSVRHVTMVLDDFSDMLRWHFLFLEVHKPKFLVLAMALAVQLLPRSRLVVKVLLGVPSSRGWPLGIPLGVSLHGQAGKRRELNLILRQFHASRRS